MLSFFFYPSMTYMLWVILPSLVLAGVAQFWLKSAFAKYSKVPIQTGISGREAAERILMAAGIPEVRIQPVAGMLSDHYNPMNKTVFLSEEIMNGRTPAAVGIAAHECGHALQHAQGYAPMQARAALVPVANLSSSMAMPMIFLGIIIQPLHFMAWAGVIAFALAVLFHIVTLPVEFDASHRAIKIVEQSGMATAVDMKGVRSCLYAAGFTYVAATTGAILQLLYFISLASGSGGND